MVNKSIGCFVPTDTLNDVWFSLDDAQKNMEFLSCYKKFTDMALPLIDIIKTAKRNIEREQIKQGVVTELLTTVF